MTNLQNKSAEFKTSMTSYLNELIELIDQKFACNKNLLEMIDGAKGLHDLKDSADNYDDLLNITNDYVFKEEDDLPIGTAILGKVYDNEFVYIEMILDNDDSVESIELKVVNKLLFTDMCKDLFESKQLDTIEMLEAILND